MASINTNTETRDFFKSATFGLMCKRHSVEKTYRQASKYRNKKGLLYKKEKGLA